MTDRELMQQACAVPLHEQLAFVPVDARLVIDDPDGMGTRYIPVGRMCQEAAAELRRLHEVNLELLEALDVDPMREHWEVARDRQRAIKALRERLAQPEQCPHGVDDGACKECYREATQPEQKRPPNCGTSYCSCIECVMEPEQTPLDRMAENARELGLDYEPVNTKVNSEAIPEQISEPVAWKVEVEISNYQGQSEYRTILAFRPDPKLAHGTHIVNEVLGAIPLYTTPPRREWVGLTEEDVKELEATWEATPDWVAFADAARAIEAKLKEKNA